jgi:transcriptional regulator with XRE-family HTH domain
MSEFGAQLKQARESRGIALRQIASATKISTVALESLERGDLRKLPGGIFSRAFVRAYAIEVGLDPDEVVEQFLKELGTQVAQAGKDDLTPVVSADDRAFLEQQRRAAMALRIVLAVVGVLLVGAIVWWQLTRTPAPVAEVPVTQTAPTPVVPLPVTAEPEPEAATVWIDISVTDHCWVEVETDGTRQPALVLAPGDRRRYEAARELVLKVGNAGVVTWSVNDRLARPLGRINDVRTVTISSSNVADFFQVPVRDEHPTPSASATDHP